MDKINGGTLAYLYIAGTVLFTVYGQLIIKLRMSHHPTMPSDFVAKLSFLFKLLLDPWILSGFIAAFVASFFWLAALSTRIELNKAYPFTALTLVLVVILSTIIFKESITIYLIAGVLMVIIGVVLVSLSL